MGQMELPGEQRAAVIRILNDYIQGNLPTQWKPIDLAESMRTFTRSLPPSIALLQQHAHGYGLFYPRTVNSIHGVDASGKTLLMQHVAKQEMLADRGVVWLNYEDADEAIMVDRYRSMQVPATVASHMAMFNVTTRFNMKAIEEAVHDLHVELIVVDSIGEAMHAHDFDENKDMNVAGFFAQHLRPLARLGPAVVCIDHATKAQDNVLFPAGSKRKRAAIDGAAYWCALGGEHGIPFNRGNSGYAVVVCAKDRHGYYQRSQRVAFFEVISTGILDATGHEIVDWTMETALTVESSFIEDGGVDVENMKNSAHSNHPSNGDRPATVIELRDAIHGQIHGDSRVNGMPTEALVKKLRMMGFEDELAIMTMLDVLRNDEVIMKTQNGGWALYPDPGEEF
jgi:hypothetical protein